MYNFWVLTWSNFKGLYDWLHWRGYIANVIAQPLMMVLLYALLGQYALDAKTAAFFAIGMSISTMTYNITSAITQSYANDRWYQTLSLLYITRASRFKNFLSRWILHYPTGLVNFITALAMIRLLTNIDFGLINWGGLTIAVLVLAASLCGFAQLLGIFSIIYREWLNTLAFSLGISFILSGIIVPIDRFPAVVQEIAKLLPVTNGLLALREAFSGAPLGDIYLLILREAATGFVYYMVGFFGFIFFERVAKRTGTLEADSF